MGDTSMFTFNCRWISNSLWRNASKRTRQRQRQVSWVAEVQVLEARQLLSAGAIDTTFGDNGTTPGAAGHVDLIVKATPAFSNLTSSPQTTYGSPGLILAGMLSAPGPIYPANGETIGVTINGNTQTTTVNDAIGDFSIIYNPSGLSVAGSPYSITYGYAGNGTMNSATDASTTLTVNSLPVILTGTRPYDGTTAADATILSVTNKVGSDVVTVASGSAAVASSNAGAQSISSVGTLTLGGAAAGNYTLSNATGIVTITVPPFSIVSQYLDFTGTNFVITWQSVPGGTYHVISSGDATAPLSSWTNVAGPITSTDTNTSATIPISSSMGVFDVKTP
jgi:hypothetical protein